MSQPSLMLRMERTIEVPAEDVYAALTTNLGLAEWLGHDVRVDARPGGRLYVFWNTGYFATGEFLELEPERMVSFTWLGRGEPGPSRVTLRIEPLRAGAASRVVLEHEMPGEGEAWDTARKAFSEGWSRALDNLTSVLEEGVDLRLYNRPMLGLSGGAEVTPEVAAERGLPVKHGVLMTDFVEGMGAAAAGLVRGDLLVRLGDDSVTGWESLAAALARHDVGDAVGVAYYRDGRRLEGEVTLFGRPRPDVPATAADAAAILRELQGEVRQALSDVLDGVPESRRARSPGGGEWSALDVLSHLVTTERALQMWLALRIQGEEAPNWASNDDVLIGSLVTVRKTSSALLADLEAAWAQTATMLELLPSAFLDRRASYTTACDLLLTGLPYHVRAHIEQIREAVQESA